MGYTVGLPPGYYVDPDDKLIKRISETMKSMWNDFLTGPPTTSFDKGYKQIAIKNFPNQYNVDQIKESLENNMKKYIPCYEGNGIESITLDKARSMSVVTFVDEETCRKFKRCHDLYRIGERNVLVSTMSLPNDDSNSFGKYVRVSLSNVIIKGNFDYNILQTYSQRIKRIIRSPNELTTTVSFECIEEAESFLEAIKEKHDASILNFPPPSPDVPKMNLPSNAVTTLIDEPEDLTLASLFDPEKKLTKVVEFDNLPQYPLKTVNIYNVIHRDILDSLEMSQKISNELVEFCSQFGKIENFQMKYPDLESDIYGTIKITFDTPHAARKCQSQIAGRFYLGNLVITQLS